MKLVADNKGRVTSPELFPPGTVFDANLEADGRRVLIEMVEKRVPVVGVRRERGFVLIDSKPDRAAIRSAIRADRDSR